MTDRSPALPLSLSNGPTPSTRGPKLTLRPRIRSFTKRVRTRFISVQNAISRLPSIFFLLFALLLNLLLVIPLTTRIIARRRADIYHVGTTGIDTAIKRNVSGGSFQLRHSQLDENSTHFLPPSRFAPQLCVRQYDQAYRVQETLRDAALRHINNNTSSSTNEINKPPPPQQLVSIAFGIQASGGTVDLLPRLLSRIYHPRNFYVVHIDAKTPKRQIDVFLLFLNSDHRYSRNVHLLRREMLTYKGISTVLNTLTLMSTAQRLDTRWSYYINLSAGDYPLISPDALSRMLSRPQVPSRLLNYVWFFPRKEWLPYSFRVRNMYWDPAASGYQSRRARLFHMRGSKLHPLEYVRAYTFTKAEAWAILSRPFIQFVTRSTFAKRMLLAHVHVLSVSEHFITDILFNHPVWRATVVPDSFRLVVWYFHGQRSGQHPYTLDAKRKNDFRFWPLLRDATAAYARKFSVKDSQIMDRIDAEISGVGLNETDPRFMQYKNERQAFYQRLVKRFDMLTKETLRQQGYSWPDTAYPDL